MHELSIAYSIIETAEAEAKKHGAVGIVRLYCRIGCLRQVQPSLLQDVFDLAKVDTMAANAVLETTTVGMLLHCKACGRESQLDGWQFDCPLCASREIQLSGGDDLELTSLELEINGDD